MGAAVRASVAAAEREAEEAAINIYSEVEPPPAPPPGTPPAHDDLAGLPPEDVAAAKASVAQGQARRRGCGLSNSQGAERRCRGTSCC